MFVRTKEKGFLFTHKETGQHVVLNLFIDIYACHEKSFVLNIQFSCTTFACCSSCC